MTAKRKQCLSCSHATVIRKLGKNQTWPIGVYCYLDDIPDGDDPRNWILSTDHKCSSYARRANKKDSAS
jgi:hypothetical protein